MTEDEKMEKMYKAIMILAESDKFAQATELHQVYTARFIDSNMDLANKLRNDYETKWRTRANYW